MNHPLILIRRYLISLTISVMALLMVGGLGWHYREKIADKLGLAAVN